MGYPLQSGEAGAARLDVLAGAHAADTEALFARLPLPPAPACLDVGCGSGAVTRMLAARFGASGGSVVGVDLDPHYLALARERASTVGNGVRYERCGVHDLPFVRAFDLVYARFLLSHLREPERALSNLVRAAKPGGIVAIEDVDFGGAFCHPPCPAFARYLGWYDTMTRGNGGDPQLGRALFGLMREAGLTEVCVAITQPAFAAGPGKHLAATTLAHIGHVLVEREIAPASELDATIAELEAYAADPTTLLGMPRVFQVWGRAPGYR